MTHRPGTQEATGAEEYQRLLTLLDERRFDEAQIRGRILLEQAETRALTRAKTHNLLCWTFVEGLKRPAPEAVLHGEEAVRLAAEVGERSLQAQSLCNLASALYQVGDLVGARRTYAEVQQILTVDQQALPYGELLCLQGLAQLDLVEGDLPAALRRLDEADRLCQGSDSRYMPAEIARRKALVLLKLGQADQAAQLLDGVDEEALFAGPRGLWWRTHLRYTKARVEVERGHWLTARPLVINTLALARELGDLPVLAECTCLLALLEKAEQKREAQKRARAALTYAISSGRRDVVDDVRERLKDLLAMGA